MATYALNPNGLLDSGAELQAVTDKIAASIAELNRHVKTYVDANAGSAADAYTQAQTKWNKGLEEMQTALIKGKIDLDQIRDNYGSADVKGASLFGGTV